MGCVSSKSFDPYFPVQCCHLILNILQRKETKDALLYGRNGEETQLIVDFLDHALNDPSIIGSFDEHARNSILHLLIKLAKRRQLFPKRLFLTDMRFDRANKEADDESGFFAHIYKTDYKRKKVCVKVVRLPGEDTKKQKRLRVAAKEIILLAHISHANIIRLHGITTDVKGETTKFCPVLPWMHNGNLSKYLKDFPGSPRIALIHDIVSGLEYLHNQNIVHGDLKAKNVLVSNQGRAILADFGISHVHKTDLTSTKDNSGTYNWMAPEILSSPKPTPESDIWSLGCTCYEALTGKWPFPDLEQTKDVIKALSEVPVIPGKVDQIELEGWPENQQKVWKLVESCWESEPRDRPSALTLRSEIKELDPDAESKPKSNDNDNRTRRMKTKRIDFRRVDSILSQITSPDGATKALNQATDCNGLEKGESYLTNMTNSQSNHPPQPNHPR